MEEDINIYEDLPNFNLAESDINVRFIYGNSIISAIQNLYTTYVGFGSQNI